MAELDKIDPRGELAARYLDREDVDGNAALAAAHFARDLMRGDPASFKAGYTQPNALLAAHEMFGTAAHSNYVELLLGELLEEDARPKGVLGLTAYENALVARALGVGDPLGEDEVKVLTKIARLAEFRREDVSKKVAFMIDRLEIDGEGPLAADMKETLRLYEEATTVLLEAVRASRGGEASGGADGDPDV